MAAPAAFGGGYPFAMKTASGKINAITGEEWQSGLNRQPQDYLVLPEQPWLDGFAVEKGIIRQFVAMPLQGRAIRSKNNSQERLNLEEFKFRCSQ